VTELSDLHDLTPATVRDLVGRAVLDGVRLDGADLSGVSVAQVRMLECALVDCTADTAELPGVTAVDVYVGDLNAQTLSFREGDWRDATWADMRVGALLADGGELTDVTIRDSRIDLLSLRGTRIRRLTLSNCRVDTLDVSMATIEDLAVIGGSVGELFSGGARMARVDVSDTALGAVGHPGSLRGLVLSSEQVDDIAPALAAHLGIKVRDSTEERD
jgi:uncharacterized protein YjbI with pentapeptide repeats